MLPGLRTNQEYVDFLFENPARQGACPVHETIAALAEQGLASPAHLSEADVKRISFALLVQFAQMGIGHDAAPMYARE